MTVFHIIDPDMYETVVESWPCACGGSPLDSGCTGNCTGWASVSQRVRSPEDYAAHRAERIRREEDEILRRADAIRAARGAG